MTAAPATAARSGGTAVSVSAVRAFIGKRRRRSWLDWYFAGFAAVVAALYLSDLLASPLSRLGSPSGHAAAHAATQAATQAAASQAVAGAGLVIGAAAGLLLLAQALGPLALSPADASWLLLSPLDRRAVLRRSAVTAGLLTALPGALLGVLALAMAGPYLRPAGGSLPASWLLLSALAGAGCCLAVAAAEALAQPNEHNRSLVHGCCAAVAAAALAGAMLGERSAAVSHAITGGFGGLSTPAFGIAAAVALALSAIAGSLVWLLLPRFPASVLRTDSARAGRALTAAAFLNLPLLAWIAEDDHWRGRLLPSRRWPKLPPAMALAWADWRRLGRRPGSLAAGAVSTVAPALLGAAITGHARGYVAAAALLAGGLAAGVQGTAASKRDLNDPALVRMFGVAAGPALAARAVLPALLATAWLTIALTVLAAIGVLPGWLWPLLGVAAGPALAAVALRMARTAPINPAEPGIDTPMGTYYPWMITRALSVLLGLVAVYPALRSVHAGHVKSATITGQLVLSAVVLGGYLVIAGHQPGSPGVRSLRYYLPMTSVELEFDGLRRQYGTVTALDGLSFDVPAGQVFGFLGPNGAGKTTAMRAIFGVAALDAGEIGVTVLFSSHQLDLVEDICEAVAIIHRGRLVASGDVADLRRGDRPRLAVRVGDDPAGTWSGRVGAGLGEVEAIRADGTVLISLTHGGDSQRILDLARAAGPVEHFAFEDRRLSEVFRTVTGASVGQAEAEHAAAMSGRAGDRGDTGDRAAAGVTR